MALPQSVFGEL